eukprot:superscaffoldBa00006877_g21982
MSSHHALTLSFSWGVVESVESPKGGVISMALSALKSSLLPSTTPDTQPVLFLQQSADPELQQSPVPELQQSPVPADLQFRQSLFLDSSCWPPVNLQSNSAHQSWHLVNLLSGTAYIA